MSGRFVAVCFDLDGVLIHTMPLHAKAWRDALRPFGLSVARRSIYAWEGEPGVVTARTLLSRRRKRLPSQTAIARLLGDKERRFARLARQIQVDPRLARLLGRLSRRGVRVGLVTGTSSREVHRVVPKRILAHFDAVVTGDHVQHGKPHPEPYRVAFRQLQVAPRRAIVVENAPYGIRSARRACAGLVIALRSSLPSRWLREADLVVPSVARLCTMVDDLTTPIDKGSKGSIQ